MDEGKRFKELVNGLFIPKSTAKTTANCQKVALRITPFFSSSLTWRNSVPNWNSENLPVGHACMDEQSSVKSLFLFVETEILLQMKSSQATLTTYPGNESFPPVRATHPIFLDPSKCFSVAMFSGNPCKYVHNVFYECRRRDRRN